MECVERDSRQIQLLPKHWGSGWTEGHASLIDNRYILNWCYEHCHSMAIRLCSLLRSSVSVICIHYQWQFTDKDESSINSRFSFSYLRQARTGMPLLLISLAVIRNMIKLNSHLNSCFYCPAHTPQSAPPLLHALSSWRDCLPLPPWGVILLLSLGQSLVWCVNWISFINGESSAIIIQGRGGGGGGVGRARFSVCHKTLLCRPPPSLSSS